MPDIQKMLDANCQSIANCTAEEWFDEDELMEPLDIEYMVDSHKKVLGVILCMTIGGPNIYVDTRAEEVRGYWGFTKSVTHMDPDICEQLTDYYGEFFDA